MHCFDNFALRRLFGFPMGFMFNKADFRVDYLDPTLMILRDSGLIEFYFGKWRSPKYMKERIVFKDEAVTIQLMLLPTGIWAVGVVVALILLALEAYKKKQHKLATC